MRSYYKIALKTYLRFVLSIGTIILFALLTFMWIQNRRAASNFNKIKSVKLGMSVSEVEKIMGNPIFRRKYESDSIYTYSAYLHSSNDIEIIFDQYKVKGIRLPE